MIYVTRLNQGRYLLNSDLIEQIETHPDTVISLINRQKHIVLESPEEILERIIAFRKRIGFSPRPLPDSLRKEEPGLLAEIRESL